MVSLARRLLLWLLICAFLSACGRINASSNDGQPSPHVQPTATRSAITSTTHACPAAVSQLSGCLTPYDIRTAYGMDSLIQNGITGKGQTVIDIVSFGSPTLKQDMDVFDQAFGLPPLDLQVISPINEAEYDPHHDKTGWAEETELDVQIIHALAPDAKVVVLTSPVAETEGTVGLPEFRQLIQYALDHKLGNIVSQSWGASEVTLQDAAGQAELQKWQTLLQQSTTQQGMTYLSSSGDNGATDYTDLTQSKLSHVPTTSFAASSPWVTAVGGTNMRRSSSTFHEIAWSSSGGGFSKFYQEPDYQKGLSSLVQNTLNNRRGVPDVAAVADPNTGMAIYLHGQWTLAGGTSASAPVWAALVALANQQAGHPLGFLNPGLYKLAESSSYNQDFHDITEGNNSNAAANVQGYAAIPHWDAVTGLGSPNAEKLIPDLITAMK